MIQKSNSAADRMAKLPIVRSVWCRLSVLYTDTKSYHPNLKVICESLEDGAVILCTMALHTISPVMIKLEPQMSIANDIACKSLDWLESTFPLLQASAEEVVAIAKDKIDEAQEVVSDAGTRIGYVRHTVDHAIEYHSSPVIERAMTVAEAGLNQALSFSEELVDRMLTPVEDEKEEEAKSLQGFESTALRTYSVRLLSICTKLYRRTYKAIEKLSTSSSPTRRLQTPLATLIYSTPQYLQHQAVTVVLFISQMYTLSCPSPPQQMSNEGTRCATTSLVPPAHKDLLKVKRQESPTWRLRLPEATDCECTICEARNDGSTAKSCNSP